MEVIRRMEPPVDPRTAEDDPVDPDNLQPGYSTEFLLLIMPMHLYFLTEQI
jgi:hypothetical protein